MKSIKNVFSYAVVLGFGVCFTPTACNQDIPDQGSTSFSVSTDEGKPVVEECFSSLISGDIDTNGQMDSITFASGSCQGGSKAISSMTKAKAITVIKGKTKYNGQVAVKKGVVYVVDGSEMVPFAKLHSDPSNAELVVTNGADVASSKADNEIEVRL